MSEAVTSGSLAPARPYTLSCHCGAIREVEGIDVFALEVRRYDGRNHMPPGPLP